MDDAARVEHLFQLWSEGRIDEGKDLMDPAIEWLEPPETIGRHVVTGPDAAVAALANWVEQFDTLRAETTELVEREGRVLHAMQQFARARGSSVDIEAELYMVWSFRDGKAVRMEMYNRREDAEKAFYS